MLVALSVIPSLISKIELGNVREKSNYFKKLKIIEHRKEINR